MATVTGYTAERMKEIEDNSIVSGAVVGNDLILTKFNGETINAGPVVGSEGPEGPPGPTTGGTVRIPHTWHIPGEVKIASGDTDLILPFDIPVLAGKSSTIVAVRYKINSGTSVTFKMQANGVDIAGFTGLVAAQVAAQTDPADVSLTNGDSVVPVVTAVSATPKNLRITAWFDYTF